MNLDSKKFKKTVKNLSLGIVVGLVLSYGVKCTLKKEPVMQEPEVTDDILSEVRIEKAVHYDNGEILFLMHFPDELESSDDKEEEFDLNGVSYIEIYGEDGENQKLTVEEYLNLQKEDNAKSLVKSK